MKHKTTKSERKNYLACLFDKLRDQDQAYMETLTTQLAAINETAPENQQTIGKNPQTMLPIKAKIG